jgi:putative transcriptional regulator
MRKRKNETIDRLLRLSRELHACGAFCDEGIRRIEHAGIAAPAPLMPEDFRIIREQSDYSVYTLARLLNISARRYRRWEQGLARGPQGVELRFLRMLRDRGVEAVFP